MDTVPRTRRERWLAAVAPGADGLVVMPALRRLGIGWVCVSAAAITWLSSRAHTPDRYVLVLVVLACGCYTVPGLVAGAVALRYAPADVRRGFGALYVGLASVVLIGVGMLVGLATGWRWGNHLGLVAVAASGVAHTTGLAILVRSRSGRRRLSVDLIEAVAAVVAVTAPLVVLWGPAVLSSDQAWFTRPSALVLVFTISGVYWTAVLCVRVAPRRSPYLYLALAMSCIGSVNVTLQVAQGVSGFTLPAPPLIALTCATASMYLLSPLYAPVLLPPGLGRLPAQGQVRGALLATVVAAAGIVALLGATAAVADERPWAVGFALGVVTVLFVLAALRQLCAVGETRRLYRQVELASEERGRLLARMVERAAHDRHRFAGQLHEQAVSATASLAVLAVASPGGGGQERTVTANDLVGSELRRYADSLRDLAMLLRPGRGPGEWLTTPTAAQLAACYGDGPRPELSVTVADDLVLDWVTETVVLHIVHEALRNVWRHSRATAVAVTVAPVPAAAGVGVGVWVSDDGVGFDPAVTPEGAGLTSMRSSVAVVGGTLVVGSSPGRGTTVSVRLGVPGDPRSLPPGDAASTAPPVLRLVRSGPTHPAPGGSAGA